MMLKRLLPALLLLAAASARTPAWADPALWAVHGRAATVYLLGSVHVLRPETAWEGSAIRRAFDAAEECWFETDTGDEAELQVLVLRNAVGQGRKLSDLLTPEQMAELSAVAGQREARMLDQMRPWFAALFVAVQPLVKAGFDPALGVDQVLKRQAREAGKRVAGIEPAEAQVRMLADLPQDLAVKMLLSVLGQAAEGPPAVDRMVARWQAGDFEGSTEQTAPMREAAPDLYRRVFTDRNAVFADAVETLAAGSKTALVTVGAGHLAGPDNVRDMLARRGLTVERVPE